MKTNAMIKVYLESEMVEDINQATVGRMEYWAKKTNLGVQFANTESELAYGSQVLAKFENSKWLQVHKKYVIGTCKKQLRAIGRRDGEDGESNFMHTIKCVKAKYGKGLTTSTSAAASLAKNTMCDKAFLVRTYNETDRGDFTGENLPANGQTHVLHVMVLFFLKVDGMRRVVLFDPLTKSAAYDVRKGNLPTVVVKMIDVWHYPERNVITVHGNQVGSQKDCMKRSAEFLESCLASEVFYKERVLNFV